MEDHEAALGRRRVLRGAAIATAAGAGVAALSATPAHAAQNDPVLLGQVNDSGATQTSLAADSATLPTLTLGNTLGAPLLIPQTGFAGDQHTGFDVPIGTVRTGPYADLRLKDKAGEYDGRTGWLYSDVRALQTVPISPTRLFDSRNSIGWENIVTGSGNIASGRLKAGKTIVLKLDEEVFFGEAVRLNVTVSNTAGSGYVTVWGRGGKPLLSSVNWWAGGQILSNTVLSQLGFYATTSTFFTDVISIYTSQTTAVIVDVQAFIVSHPMQVRQFMPPGMGAAKMAAGARRSAYESRARANAKRELKVEGIQ